MKTISSKFNQIEEKIEKEISDKENDILKDENFIYKKLNCARDYYDVLND